MKSRQIRTRYFVFASVMYVLLGFVISVRALMAHTFVLIILGLVFVALGAVRLRDYALWRGGAR